MTRVTLLAHGAIGHAVMGLDFLIGTGGDLQLMDGHCLIVTALNRWTVAQFGHNSLVLEPAFLAAML